MKIAFLVTSHGISGGHNIVFEYAYHLARGGHEVDIIGRSVGQFEYAYAWHDRARYLKFISIEDCVDGKHYDIAIATNFNSAFCLHLVPAAQYCLFMQANEPEFFSEADGAYKRWMMSVLDLKLPTIVSADWMRTYLYQRNGHEAMVCQSGIRKDLFTCSGARIQSPVEGGIRVLVEGPMHVPHKNVLASLNLCLASRAREVWLLTSSSDLEDVPSGVRTFSSVALLDLGNIYRSCDLLVKLSTSEGMYGPPLEMMHCGGTVVSYDVPGHEEYLVHEVNSLIVPMGEEVSVLRAINRLCDCPEQLASLKNHAGKTAGQWPDWDVASKNFERCLVRARESSRIDQDCLFQITQNNTRNYLRDRWRHKRRSIS